MFSCSASSNQIADAQFVFCGADRKSESSHTISSPCKLNIFLEVLQKRSDGYHDLETVMLRTNLADHLTARRNDSGKLSLRFSDATPEALQSGVPLDRTNLILRAAEAVRKKLGQNSGADFVLHKRIPPGSGLGGGSGNAAAALVLCRQVWNADLSNTELHEIAASLGSDINFLLSGHRAAVCRGRGEVIEPILVGRRLHFVAFRPRTGNSTQEVFRGSQVPIEPRSSTEIVRNVSCPDGERLSSLIFNRLTEPARQINPEMSELMNRLQHIARRPVFMSGSGSSVYVVADSVQHAASLLLAVRGSLKICGCLLTC